MLLLGASDPAISELVDCDVVLTESGLAYKVHPYGHTTMGYFADIEDMPNQLDYSKQFFDRWYRPEMTSVIIVGDVDADKAHFLSLDVADQVRLDIAIADCRGFTRLDVGR